ncbi:MAG: zinc ribbon domain-containing protein [Candidatus Solibacter usitatus]|nr:zinc ribbon domain-containing protein [Candidatus Solibacter usitatus]
MPMYEYRCTECGKQYEQLRRMTEADTGLMCPQCGSPEVQRQISACSIGGGASSGASGGGCGPRGGFS